MAANWSFYHGQTPTGYPANCDYSGFYYTNWDLVPGTGLVFKVWPTLESWLQKKEVSLRFVFLNTWTWMALVCGTISGAIAATFLRPLPRHQRVPRRTGDRLLQLDNDIASAVQR